MRAWGGGAALGAWLVLATATTAARALADVSIVELRPARSDSLLVCELDIRGLPDMPSMETLRSGLPSSFVFSFSVVDGSDREVGSAEVEVRIEPDLWEQRVAVRTPLREWKVPSPQDVVAIMRTLGPLPVLRLDAIGGRSVRIRTALTVHALAPAEESALHRVISGDTREPNRREVSVGLSSLVRYFLGDKRAAKPDAAFDTPFFNPPDLTRLERREPPTTEPVEEASP